MEWLLGMTLARMSPGFVALVVSTSLHAIWYAREKYMPFDRLVVPLVKIMLLSLCSSVTWSAGWGTRLPFSGATPVNMEPKLAHSCHSASPLTTLSPFASFRFVYLSSLAAVSGLSASTTADEDSQPSSAISIKWATSVSLTRFRMLIGTKVQPRALDAQNTVMYSSPFGKKVKMGIPA